MWWEVWQSRRQRGKGQQSCKLGHSVCVSYLESKQTASAPVSTSLMMVPGPGRSSCKWGARPSCFSSLAVKWPLQECFLPKKMKTQPSLPPNHIYLTFIFFKDFIYLFLERGEGREKERETSMCGCLSHAPCWGPGLQPRHVPWLGIELATLWFIGWHSIYLAAPARATFLKLLFKWPLLNLTMYQEPENPPVLSQ